MRIARRFAAVLVALSVCLTVTVANATLLVQTNAPVDMAAHVIYDAADGNVSFFSPNDKLQSMQIQIHPGSEVRFGDGGWTAVPPWDVKTGVKQTHFDFAGYADAEAFVLGPGTLPAGMTAAEVIAALDADGSRSAGGKIPSSPGGGPYLLHIPEPSSIVLAFCGLLGLLGLRRK